MKLPLDGGCLCGAVRYRVSVEPRSADYCHCGMCRRASGAPVVARLTVANAGFAWTAGEPAVHRSSVRAERLHCRTCGTQLALRDEPDYLDVTIASLDDPAAVRPSYHIWTVRRIGWFDMADDLPRHRENRRTGLVRPSQQLGDTRMKLPVDGGCLCGAVRYRISGAPRRAGYCHCRMCQRSTGAPVVAWLIVASERFAWTEGTPTIYRSSARAERLFCPVCATQLVFREPAEPHHVEVTLASLDDPEAVRPEYHGWTASRIAWFETRDDLPRHPGPSPDPAG